MYLTEEQTAFRRQHQENGRPAHCADRRRDRRKRPLSRRTGPDLRRHGPAAAVGAGRVWWARRKPDAAVPCQARDRQGLDGMLDPGGPEFDRNGTACSAFRHRGAEAPVPAAVGKGKDADGGRHVRAALRFRRRGDENQGGARRLILRDQRPEVLHHVRQRRTLGASVRPAPQRGAASTASAPSWSTPRPPASR